MTIRDQLNAIADSLKDWAAKNGAVPIIANDVTHLFQLMAEGPGKCRAAILFMSEKPRDPENSDCTGRVDRIYHIGVARHRGPNAVKGDSLTQDTAAGPALCDLIEDARDAVRCLLQSDLDEESPYYGGIELMTLDGQTIDAYRIEITLAADIKELETT